MTNELTVVNETRIITPDVVSKAEALASNMARYLGMTETVAIATFLKGWELGFKMTVAPEFISIIQGKSTLSPRGHLALLHNSGIFDNGGCFRVKDFVLDNGTYACTVFMKRGDSNVEYECTLTMEDVKKTGLIRSDSGWEKYPANLLRWQTTGFCADIVAPDIGGGMKRAIEFGADITPDGDVIQGSWEELKSKDDGALTLANLQADYDIAEILAANDNKIPNTEDEIKAVLAELEKKSEDGNES